MEQQYILIDLERSLKTGRLFFWRAAERGYTDDLEQAGSYRPERSRELVSNDHDRRTVRLSREEAFNLQRGIT